MSSDVTTSVAGVAVALVDGAVHADPVAAVALSLVVILIAAKLGGDLAVRVGQPAVLGELVIGIVLGNLALAGFTGIEPIKTDPFVEMFARVGVLILLFEVGLESTVGQMLKVGGSALLVASLGVIAPFALGWGVGAWLLPDQSPYVHAFLGATLTATSVGITARVLKDLGQTQSIEARIILGAAVIDDVLGLVILAVVTSVIVAADAGGTVSAADVALKIGLAGGFLIGSLALGVLLSGRLFRLASRLRSRGVLVAVGLSFCFALSWLASLIGLAPIVGAFAAGLVLEDVHYRDFVARGEHGLEEAIHPISSFLVPIFFVLMGMRADLASFAQPGVLALAGVLTIAAIVGKQACSLGVLGKETDRLTVGVGMIPRGEVGLIFANIGLALSVGGERIVTGATYSAVVVMVIVTTMVTPPALKWSLSRSKSRVLAQAARKVDGRENREGGPADVAGERQPSHPSPPYSAPLEEVAPPQGGAVHVKFACPYCGEVLERVAQLDETRWYLSGCGVGHSGVGIADPGVQRVKAHQSA